MCLNSEIPSLNREHTSNSKSQFHVHHLSGPNLSGAPESTSYLYITMAQTTTPVLHLAGKKDFATS